MAGVVIRRLEPWAITTETDGRHRGKRVLIRPDGRHQPVMAPRDLELVLIELNQLVERCNRLELALALAKEGSSSWVQIP